MVNKDQVVKYFYGTWKAINDETGEEFSLTITREDVNLIDTLEGEEVININFSSSAHWFGDYLVFTADNGRYFVRYADKEHLIFGEQKPGIIGNKVWELQFDRVK